MEHPAGLGRSDAAAVVDQKVAKSINWIQPALSGERCDGLASVFRLPRSDRNTNSLPGLDTPPVVEAVAGDFPANPRACLGQFQALEFNTPLQVDDVTVTFFPAGHILGSAQVLLERGGMRIVVTGDYKRLPDRTAQTFELVRCDLLVTEATFGLPVFQHPDPLEGRPGDEADLARINEDVAQIRVSGARLPEAALKMTGQ